MKIQTQFQWLGGLVLLVSLSSPVSAADPRPERPKPVLSNGPLSVSDPLSPAEALKKLHLPAGYKAEIVASEPLVLDPVAFDWDERGRLWIVEMADYPQGMDGNGKPGGRVRVLEDTQGNGHYDKSTIFAEGLNFPNGILTWRGGAIVTAAPNVLFLQDTDGDGKADKQEILIKGLQEGNQQLRANGLRWGLDNWVYVAIGGHSGKYGTDTKLNSLRSGQEIVVGARDFRFRPDTGELEPQSGPTQFGRNRDNWGHWFGTQNVNALWHYVLPEQYLLRNPHFGVTQTRMPLLTPPSSSPVYPASVEGKRWYTRDLIAIGNFTSACSGVIYRDTAMFGPDSKDALICEPVHNLVQHAVLTDNGVSFIADQKFGEEKFDFFASEDPWCRPVMVREGPDGALWVADMYRFLIEHPQWLPPVGKEEMLPYYRLGDDRGRIYRVSRTEMPDFKPVRFDMFGTVELVAALNSTNGWRRDKAHQMLLWRADKTAVAPLLSLFENAANPLARLHALCVLDGLGELNPATVIRALADQTSGVRENALRLAETRFNSEVLAAAVRLADDQDAKVRLQLAFSLGASKEALAGETLSHLFTANIEDPMIVAAVMSSATSHLRALVAAVAGKPQSSQTDALLTIALGLNDREALKSLLAPTLTASGSRYAPEQLRAFAHLLDQLAQSNRTIEQLRVGASEDALSRLLENVTQITTQAHSIAGDATAPALEQIGAAGLISRIPSMRAEALGLLSAWLDPKHPAEVQAAAIQTLTGIVVPEVPELFSKTWGTMGPATRQLTLNAWMGREAWAFDLIQRIEKKELSAAALDATQRARLIKHSNKRISQLAGKVFDTVNTTRGKIVESYRPALLLNGDPEKGHQIYSTICSVCHKRGSEGRDIGPDLLSVMEHPPEKLLDSILDPSADIQPGFNSYTCTLNTDEQIYGLLASESANSIVMKLVDGTTKTVLRNQIKTLQSQNLSLMPEGLEAAINPQQMADLIAFLRTTAGAVK
jgi:putative membrane-bound dehydrogenase-like protein